MGERRRGGGPTPWASRPPPPVPPPNFYGSREVVDVDAQPPYRRQSEPPPYYPRHYDHESRFHGDDRTRDEERNSNYKRYHRARYDDPPLALNSHSPRRRRETNHTGRHWGRGGALQSSDDRKLSDLRPRATENGGNGVQFHWNNVGAHRMHLPGSEEQRKIHENHGSNNDGRDTVGSRGTYVDGNVDYLESRGVSGVWDNHQSSPRTLDRHFREGGGAIEPYAGGNGRMGPREYRTGSVNQQNYGGRYTPAQRVGFGGDELAQVDSPVVKKPSVFETATKSVISPAGPNALARNLQRRNLGYIGKVVQPQLSIEIEDEPEEIAPTSPVKATQEIIGTESVELQAAEGRKVGELQVSEAGEVEDISLTTPMASNRVHRSNMSPRSPLKVEDATQNVLSTIARTSRNLYHQPSRRKSKVTKPQKFQMDVSQNLRENSEKCWLELPSDERQILRKRTKRNIKNIGPHNPVEPGMNNEIVEVDDDSPMRSIKRHSSAPEPLIGEGEDYPRVPRKRARSAGIETLKRTSSQASVVEVEKETTTGGIENALRSASRHVSKMPDIANTTNEIDLEVNLSPRKDDSLPETQEIDKSPVETIAIDESSGDESDMEYRRDVSRPYVSNFNKERLKAKVQECTELDIGYLSLPHQGMEDQHLNDIVPMIKHRKFAIVNLKSNNLQKVPEMLTSFLSHHPILQLNLRENMISTFPLSIASLSSLTMLDLSRNNLVDIPGALGSLINLRCLNLSCNNIRRLPSDTLSKLSKLELLLLRNNRLRRLPYDVGQMTSLVGVDLTDNTTFRWGLPKGVTANWTSILTLELKGTKTYARMPQRLKRMSAKNLCKQIDGLSPRSIKNIARRRPPRSRVRVAAPEAVTVPPSSPKIPRRITSVDVEEDTKNESVDVEEQDGLKVTTSALGKKEGSPVERKDMVAPEVNAPIAHEIDVEEEAGAEAISVTVH